MSDAEYQIALAMQNIGGFYTVILYGMLCFSVGILYAGRLDRNGLFWGPFSILFTPVVGFVFLYSLGPNVDEDRRTRVLLKSGVLKECPSCAETIKSEAKKCKHCGSDT